MGSEFPSRLSPFPLCWVIGPKLSIWGHTALAPMFWVCCYPGPPSSTPELGSLVWLCLPSHLPLLLGSSPCPAHPFFCTGTLGPGWGLILVSFAGNAEGEAPAQGPSGGGSWGLIGSILGEFLWRAGHPFPEPKGAHPAFLLRSYACCLPPPPWGESLLDEDSLGREGCAFPEDGAMLVAVGHRFCGWALAFPPELLLLQVNPRETCS